jgi:hypothetical protein
MNNEPEDPTGVIILDRGMNKNECRAMCTSPQIPLREKLFFRMIYETTTQGGPGVQDRAVEPQHRRDHLSLNPHWRSDLPGAQDMLSCASPRASTTAGPGATCAPRTMKLTVNTSEMLRHYVGNRKKGHIFINERTGKRLTLRHFEKMIDRWARLLNIQKLQSIKPSGGSII